MSNKLRARVVFDVIICRYVGEVLRDNELVQAFFRDTWDGAMDAAKRYVAGAS